MDGFLYDRDLRHERVKSADIHRNRWVSNLTTIYLGDLYQKVKNTIDYESYLKF